MNDIASELLGVSNAETPAEPTPEAKAPPEAVAEQTEAKESPETGVKEAKKPVEPPPTTDDEKVPLAALTGERKQRQEAQRELAELRKQLESKKKDPPPSVFEDDQGAFQALREEVSQNMANELLNAGEAFAISQHSADVVKAASDWVIEAAKASPYLAQKLAETPLMQRHLKAVELYSQEQARAELENPAELKARLKEEARQELLAEQKAKQEEKEKLTQSIPKSLVGSSSKGGITGDQWAGPTPLDAVIGRGG